MKTISWFLFTNQLIKQIVRVYFWFLSLRYVWIVFWLISEDVLKRFFFMRNNVLYFIFKIIWRWHMHIFLILLLNHNSFFMIMIFHFETTTALLKAQTVVKVYFFQINYYLIQSIVSRLSFWVKSRNTFLDSALIHKISQHSLGWIYELLNSLFFCLDVFLALMILILILFLLHLGDILFKNVWI